MSLLDKLVRGKTPKKRRTLIYGVHGVGKSSFANCSDRPVFIPTEDGLNDIEVFYKFPKAQSFREVLDYLGAVYSDGADTFGTLVIDSLDWLERLIFDEVCKDKKVASIEDIPYAKGYTFALTYWNQIFEGLDAIINDRNMAVILVAHSKVDKFENPETPTYDRYSPSLHKLASAKVQEWCDEVLFATYEVFTIKTEEGFNKERNQAVGEGKRILRTEERPSFVAKRRIEMPATIALDFAAYKAYFDGSAPAPAAVQTETVAESEPANNEPAPARRGRSRKAEAPAAAV